MHHATLGPCGRGPSSEGYKRQHRLTLQSSSQHLHTPHIPASYDDNYPQTIPIMQYLAALAVLAVSMSSAAARQITVYNNCPFTIWPAVRIHSILGRR
jgi:hypothetical protein